MIYGALKPVCACWRGENRPVLGCGGLDSRGLATQRPIPEGVRSRETGGNQDQRGSEETADGAGVGGRDSRANQRGKVKPLTVGMERIDKLSHDEWDRWWTNVEVVTLLDGVHEE